jgi:hypothetical protein
MASTLVALQTVTVGAGGAATVSFTSIPQTYTDLVIKVSARTTTGGVDAGTYLYFNGTVVGTARKLGGTGSVAFSDTGANIIDQGNGATTNTYGNFEVYVPNYTGYGLKSVSVDGVTETNATTVYMNMLALISTNITAGLIPVSTLGFTPIAGTFMQYSTFTLYGVYKDAAETTPAAPTIGTATAGSQAADVAFTPAGSGAPASSYVVTSSPGGLTATGGSSPIQIGGLTSGTAYTFTVRGQNPGGLGAASAASNSVTPYDGYESIATVDVGSGGLSTVTFSSIPQTYTHLQLICSNNSGNSNIQFNGDTGTNYSRHYLYGNGSTATSGANTSTTSMGIIDYTGTADIFTANIVDILDYTNTNKNKTVRVLSGVDTNGAGAVLLYSGLWRSTAAISTITITGGTAAQYSTFQLYGIRG